MFVARRMSCSTFALSSSKLFVDTDDDDDDEQLLLLFFLRHLQAGVFGEAGCVEGTCLRGDCSCLPGSCVLSNCNASPLGEASPRTCILPFSDEHSRLDGLGLLGSIVMMHGGGEHFAGGVRPAPLGTGRIQSGFLREVGLISIR